MPTKQAPKTAIIYCRVSSKKQRDAATIEVQVAACKRLVEQHGLTLLPYGAKKDGWIRDDGISGALLEGRGLKQLIDDLYDGRLKVGYLVTYNMSRLARHAKAGDFARSVKSGEDEARVYGVLHGRGVKIIDLEGVNDPGSLTTEIKKSVSGEEYGHLQRKTKDGKHDKMGKGAYSQGGSIPYGYSRVFRNGVNRKDGITLAPDENAPRLRQILKWYIEGGTAHAARKAQAEGWPTPSASRKRIDSIKEWRQSTASEMVKNLRFYLGSKVLHVEGQAYPVEYPAIITPELFARVEKRRKERTLKRKTVFLSTGYTHCGCGGYVHVRSGGTTVKRYYIRCDSGCGAMREDAFSLKLWEAVVGRLVQIKKAEIATSKTDSHEARLKAAKEKLQAVQVKLDRLLDLYTEGEIDKTALSKSNEKLKAEKAHAQAEVDRLTREREAATQRKSEETSVKSNVQKVLTRLKEGRVSLDGKRQVLQELLQGERLVLSWQKNPKAGRLTFPAFGSLRPVTVKLEADVSGQMLGSSREALEYIYKADDGATILGLGAKGETKY